MIAVVSFFVSQNMIFVSNEIEQQDQLRSEIIGQFRIMKVSLFNGRDCFRVMNGNELEDSIFNQNSIIYQKKIRPPQGDLSLIEIAAGKGGVEEKQNFLIVQDKAKGLCGGIALFRENI